jgi:hypothetical protein
VAFHALQRSIHERASQPVSITPISLTQLNGIFCRVRNSLQSTKFSFSRFLTPWFCGFEGLALFVGCDMLMRGDVADLWKLRDRSTRCRSSSTTMCRREETKFLAAVQTKYQKKNWSSVILFNCRECAALTPDYVNTATGLELHQFKWFGDDSRIGKIPSAWYHLVDEYEPNSDAKLVHYTLGGPYFDEYRGCEFSGERFDERDRLSNVTQFGPRDEVIQ